GRGIGREESLLLAARGARVVVNDWGRSLDGVRQEDDAAAATVADIRRAGGDAVADNNDVGTPTGAAAVVDRALAEWGRIDVLVNNAGTGRMAPTPADMTDEGIDMTLRAHLLGTIWTCRRAWRSMAEQGYGRIVNTSSATMLGVINTWDYPAAKGGVLGLTRSLAVTGRPLGIMVNAIMPMAYTRALHDYPNPEVRDWMAANFPAASVAPVVAFLAHDDVPCTGECIAVGGGRAGRVAIVASPGFQRDGTALTVEDVRDHWDEVMDLDDAVLMRTSRDESGMYRGQAAWTGSNAGYEEP
ncbi:MAG TPA: SDR family oxidoreductase, partial [Acidimicrobiales bacterium]|nr:SDR family oxidoreductase [Acidimicrobiales bacterium]